MIRQCIKLLLLVLSLHMLPGFFAFAADKPNDTDMATGVLVGQFKINENTPLSNGRLFVYNNATGPSSSDKLFRVPDQIVSLGPDGRFSLELPAGTYFLSASKKPAAGYTGPPPEGELIYFRTNSKGEDEAFIVSNGKKTDAGVISSSAPFKRNLGNHDKGHEKSVAFVEGNVKDADNKPVEGAVIIAYVDLNQGKVFQVSERTAKDGKFVLRLIDGGTYYLRVRSEYGGGIIKDGEIVNINDPKELIPVTVKKGETLSGVVIRIKLLERGPLYKGGNSGPIH